MQLYKIFQAKSIKKTCNEKKNRQKNKEDKQTFGVIAAKLNDLHEAFSYPSTSLPLSIGSPYFSSSQSDKVNFRNYIMKSSNPISSSFAQIAKWIIDGMVAMHSLKPR